MRNLVVPLALLTCCASAAFGQKMSLNEEDRRPEPIIDEATAETALAVNQLQMPEGIEASLWAAEPMLANPVAFDFDEKGRVFVSETYRYRTSTLDIRHYIEMLEEDMAFRTVDDRAQGIKELFGEDAPKFEIESEVVRLLEDRDGDGVADFSSVYADGFDSSLDGIASGVLARKGKVYFTNIPHLWELEGMTADGKAESRRSMHRGFGVHFGFTGHDFHGLLVGPDGKLYFTIGDRGTHLTTYEGEEIALPDEGAVFRSNFDGSDFEVVHTGLRNPQELAFDELGNLFTGDNDCDAGDFERLVQIAEGGDSGWRIGHQHAPLGGAGVWMSEGWWKMPFEGRARFALPPISYIEDGPSGIAYYPGTGLSPEYRGHLFVTHFKGSIANSGIYTYTMEPKGSSFQLGEKKMFLQGILPTDVSFAPDGKFYVLDWVNGWPKSNKGRIYALSHPDHVDSPLVQQTERLIGGGMEKRSAKELAQLLGHANWNVRLEAQLELADRGSKSVPTFARIAQDESAELYPRLHATWGLGILAERGAAKAKRTISDLARSQTDEVRAQATKLIGDHGISQDNDLLISYLKDPSARVRYFAAQSLGKLGKPESAQALVEAARANAEEDLYLSHAIVMGLTGTRNPEVLAKSVTDDSKAVRTAVLLAYRRLGDPQVARFLKDSDKEIVFEAARAINDTPIEAAFHALAAAADSEFASDPILGNRALNALFRLGGEEQAEGLARFAAKDSNPDELRIEALTQLSSWPEPAPRDRIMGVYRPLPQRDAEPAIRALASVSSEIFASRSGAVQAEFIAAASALGMTEIADQLYALVMDEERDGQARVAAFNALSEQDDPRLDELVVAASQSNASELRLATLPIVARRSPEQAETTLALMIEGNVEEQRVAYETLADSNQPFAARLLSRSLQRLVRDEVPLAAQLELIEAAEKHSDPQVQAAFADYQKSVADEAEPIAPYRFALEGGELRPGYNVYYYNQAMACVRCHIDTGPGEAAGPNLTDVGLRLDRKQLLEAIVAPNASMAEGFDNVIVTLKDGSSKVGVITKETSDTLVLKAPAGDLEEVAKSTIERRDSMPSSMPDIFKTFLSREELRDLVEYLAHRTQDPNARAVHGE